MMKSNVARRPGSPRKGLWIQAWPSAHLIPPVVFVILFVLSQQSAASLARGAFWFWLAAVVLDEALARINLVSRPFRESRSTEILARTVLPLFSIFLLGYAGTATDTTVSKEEFFATAFICGIVGAIFAVPTAHELMHRKNRFDRISAVTIMSIFTYPHFCITHVHGHHRHVATFEDPATARLGESLYEFFQRSIPGGVAYAWRFEARRLRHANLPVWRAHNRLVSYAAFVVAIYGVFFVLFGMAGMAFLAVQGIAAVFTLEAMNYVQHYGLRRNVSDGNVYEQVDDRHSWDTHHPVTNLLMLDLGHHSDHHRRGPRPVRGSGNPCGARLLPFGYFALWGMAIWPPLWRRVMDHRVRATRRHIPVSLSA